jgi:hypothetical protein
MNRFWGQMCLVLVCDGLSCVQISLYDHLCLLLHTHCAYKTRPLQSNYILSQIITYLYRTSHYQKPQCSYMELLLISPISDMHETVTIYL